MPSIADRIKEGLQIRGMKQSDLVKATGIGKSSISTYLSGSYEPKQRNIHKIAQALKVSEAWLLGNDVSMSPVNPSGKGIRIPVLGTVAAGIPLEATENIIDYEEISPELARTGAFFVLRVRGDSMAPRFQEGDYVVIRKQESVENGEIAVVMINGNDATVKKFYRSAAGVTLVGINPSFTPLVFTPQEVEQLPVRVIGKVVELRAKF